MKRIRLQIHILPWQDAALSSHPATQLRQEKILPWTEPCDESLTIQELSEKIVQRFANIHKGKGLLVIKYILNKWGSIQDGPLTVGECFENPSDNGDISNSIVNVARFPPTASELENPQRFASIARESTARPQKRRFEQFIPPPSRSHSPQISCEVPDNLDWASGNWPDSHKATIKRRKVQGKKPLEYDMPDKVKVPGRDNCYRNLYSIPRHWPPSIQVFDSQQPPAENNPYDTPSSVSLDSPQGLISSSRTAKLVPDSPPNRNIVFTNTYATGIFENDIDISKAESPELNLPVHEVPPFSRSAEKPNLAQGFSEVSGAFHSSDLDGVGSNAVNLAHNLVDPEGYDGSLQQKADFPSQISEAVNEVTNLTSDINPRHDNILPLKAGKDIFDPIDTDSDNSRQLPKKNIRRLKGTSNPAYDLAINLRDGVNDKLSEPFADVSKSHNASRNEARYFLESEGSRLSSQKQSATQDRNKTEKKENSPNLSGEATGGANNRVHLSDEPQVLPQSDRSQDSESSKSLKEILIEKGDKTNEEPSLSKNQTKAKETSATMVSTESKASGEQSSALKASRSKYTEDHLQQVERASGEKRLAKGQARKASLLKEDGCESKNVQLNEDKAKLHKTQLKAGERASETIEKSKLLGFEKSSIPSTKIKEVKSKGKNEETKRRNDLTDGKRPHETVPSADEQKISSGEQNSRLVGDRNDERKIQDTIKRTSTIGVSKTSQLEKKPTPKQQNTRQITDTYPTTPSSRRDSIRARKSMTPAFPEATTKIKVEIPQSHRVPSKGAAVSGAPLRSILKRSSSSVIDLDPPDVEVSRAGVAPAKINEHDKKLSSPTKTNRVKLRAESKSGSGSSMTKLKASTSMAMKDTGAEDKGAGTERGQKKLNNITVDKKMKGRVVDPPTPSKSVLPQEIVLSSDDERSVSSFYSDDDSVRAGPSTKHKKIPQLSKSSMAPNKDLISSSASGDLTGTRIGQHTSPASSNTNETRKSTRTFQNSTIKAGKTNVKSSPTSKLGKEPSLPKNRKADEPTAADSSSYISSVHMKQSSTNEGNIDPQIISSASCLKPPSPRAPAQYMSKPVSISSDSSSGMESESESGSESRSESEDNDTILTRETRLGEVKEYGSEIKSESTKKLKDVEMADTYSISTSHSGNSSLISRPDSAGLQSAADLQTNDVEQVEREANEQLQRDFRSSMESVNPAKTSAPMSRLGGFQGSSDSRPTSRFISMTDLKNKKFRHLENQDVDPGLSGSSKSNVISNVTDKDQYNDSDYSNSSDDDSSDSFSTSPSPKVPQASNSEANNLKSKPHKGVGRLIKLHEGLLV